MKKEEHKIKQNIFDVKSISEVELSLPTDCRQLICNSLDDIETLYVYLFRIMASSSMKLHDMEIDNILDYLHSWLFEYIRKPFIKENFQKICTENQQLIIAYIRKTFRNHILSKFRADKKSTFSDDKDSYLNPESESTETEISLNEATMKTVSNIILSLPPKQQQAFLNLYFAEKNEPRDIYIEDESNANRYQLRKRMKNNLKVQFQRHHIATEDWNNYQKSDFMSEIYELLTSNKVTEKTER